MKPYVFPSHFGSFVLVHSYIHIYIQSTLNHNTFLIMKVPKFLPWTDATEVPFWVPKKNLSVGGSLIIWASKKCECEEHFLKCEEPPINHFKSLEGFPRTTHLAETRIDTFVLKSVFVAYQSRTSDYYNYITVTNFHVSSVQLLDWRL